MPRGATVRVLVVDDHEFWRSHVSSALRESRHCQVIGEAADGLEAVQKAENLKPDLIVLDIGLPRINGIEVARRILASAPDSKILFLSEHRLPEIAQAALGTGAHGYVVKSDAGSDLLPAITAILEGKPFVTARLAAHGVDGSGRVRVRRETRRHEMQLCPDEASLLDGFARFAADALQAGSTAIVVTTSAHRQMVHRRVQACGLDIDLAIEAGRYVWLDVADTLSAVMVDGWPDEARFWEATTALITAAAGASTCTPARVAACGEAGTNLWKQGRAAAAIRLEHLWDEVARAYDVDLMCAYSVNAPLDAEENRLFQQVCAEHSAVRSR